MLSDNQQHTAAIDGEHRTPHSPIRERRKDLLLRKQRDLGTYSSTDHCGALQKNPWIRSKGTLPISAQYRRTASKESGNYRRLKCNYRQHGIGGSCMRVAHNCDGFPVAASMCTTFGEDAKAAGPEQSYFTSICSVFTGRKGSSA